MRGKNKLEGICFARKLKKLNKNSMKILLNGIGLDKESKEILYKRYVLEMSIVEIANDIGYTKESVNNLIAKSRRSLEDIILDQYELLDKNIQKIADFIYEL